MFRLLFSFFAFSFFAEIVHAASPLSKAGGAKVSKGETAIESRFGFTNDAKKKSEDKRYRMRQHIDYGFTDIYALRLINFQDKRQNDNFEHEKFAVENRFHIIKKDVHGWDGGFRLIYNHKDGDKLPHDVGLTLHGDFTLNNSWKYRSNILFGHEIGNEAEDGLELSFRNQISKVTKSSNKYIKKFDLGLAIFNDFGNLRKLSGYSDQDHAIKPFIKSTFSNNVDLKMSYGFGISDYSPDHLFKLSIGRKF